jgi:2-polyprenyl-6-methoxyphenol hydroxylase-like FAD-dependent oxidoreductase
MTLKIAIIGAGPAGLTLAKLLQTKGIKSTVYEREESHTARNQGGTLDLHAETGQLALKLAGLVDKFEALARYDGEDMKILDKHGKIYVEEIVPEGVKGGRPEIDRKDLRRILLESLETDSILWNRKLTSVEEQSPGKYIINVSHGDNATTDGPFDLVVGADGAWSRIRALLTDVKPEYSGLVMIESSFDEHVDQKHPKISALCRRGTVLAHCHGQGLIAQRQGTGAIRVYTALKGVPENWIKECGIPFDNKEATRQKLIEVFQGWNDELLDLIRLSDTDFIPRAMYQLPIGRAWHTKSGITLIGDAAHLMTPSGEGVNLAMRDAVDLVNAITDNNDLDQALKIFEAIMNERSTKAAEFAASFLEMCYGENAPVELVKMFEPPQE